MNYRWKIAQFFEAWWWRFYLAKKPLDTYLHWKRQYWQQFLEKHQISIEEKDRILDAGCGPAGIFMMFTKNEVWAVDPLLEKYQHRLGPFSAEKYPNTIFLQKPIESFRSEIPFQVVFCINAINHVAELDVCLKNLRNATAQNGILYLSVDAHNHRWLKKIFRLFPGDILHPHQMDLDEYRQTLERAGFQVLKTSLLNSHLIFNYYLLNCIPSNPSNNS